MNLPPHVLADDVELFKKECRLAGLDVYNSPHCPAFWFDNEGHTTRLGQVLYYRRRDGHWVKIDVRGHRGYRTIAKLAEAYEISDG
jgi:hypothetical protein